MSWQKQFSSVCAALLAAVLLSGCGERAVLKKNSFDTQIESTAVGDVFIAQNENYRLEINDTTMGVNLIDLKTGKIFGTNPANDGEQQFDEFGMPIKRHPQVESTVFIEYLDSNTNTVSQLISYNAAVNGGRTVVESIENGIKVEYYFEDAQVMIPVTYTLRENSVLVGIDPKEIQEGDNMLISVSVMPFFCSVANDEQNGYLVYPSGSGALVYPKEISQSGEAYEAEVYGKDLSKEVWDKVTTDKSVRLPIYGAKSGSSATFAIIEQGAESSVLELTSGSTSVGYSSVYVKYQLRGFTNNLKELYNNRFYEGQVYSDNMVQSPLAIGFYPLNGDSADYSGMAGIYREYLDSTENEKAEDTYSTVDLTFIGGAMIVKSFLGIPYETLYPTTTLEEAADIIAELNDKADISNICLKGFGESGINSYKLAGNFEIDGKLGSIKNLASVGELCGNNGIGLYFDFNNVTFNNSANGYSTYFDAAVRANRKTAKTYNFDIAVLGRETDGAYSLLARDRLNDSISRIISTADKMELPGIALSTLTSVSYSDYTDKNDTEYYSKANFGAQVSDMLDSVSESGKKVMASDANAFAAAKADIVINSPTISAEAFEFDEDIPLYQMVFRGRAAISVESLNLVSDSRKQLLRAVESGSGLGYTLIADYDTVLLDGKQPVFYNSLYEDVSEKIIDDYSVLSEYYKKIGSSRIASHRILENGVRETVFENSVTVYVNYSDGELASPAGNVPANGFLIGEADV